MKKLFLTIVSSIILLAGSANADTAVAVVNIPKIMHDSKAATSLRSQLQAKQKSFQNDLDAKEKALLAEDQALVREKNTADKAVFDKKVKEFREKAATEQRAVQGKKAALDKSFAGALEEIQKNVIEIVKQMAGEKKLNLVLSSSQALYSDSTLDITEEVLKRLDARLPTIAVKF